MADVIDVVDENEKNVEISYEEYAAFPTMVYKFKSKLPVVDHIQMAQWIKRQKEAEGQVVQTEGDLYKLSYFRPLVETTKQVSAEILQKLGYKYDKLEMTGMWGNYLSNGQTHPPHTHSNNVLSGVYYVESQKGASPIQFFDPRPIAHHLKPVNRPNWENAGMIQFDAEQGTGIIFPSWLQHWVPPTQTDRVSVSWNIIPRGHYGSISEYQYAHI